MGFLHSSLRGLSCHTWLRACWSLEMVLPRACALAAHTPHVLLLTARSWSGAGPVLRAQPAQPGVFAAGQMCGHRTRDRETSCWAEPALPKLLPARLPGRCRQRAKNPNCYFKMILKRALNADTLDTGMYS